jgi:hypothetical protein
MINSQIYFSTHGAKIEQYKIDEKIENPDKTDVLSSNNSSNCDNASGVAISLRLLSISKN